MKNINVTLIRRTKATIKRIADRNTDYADPIASSADVECHYDDELDPSNPAHLRTMMDIAIRQMYDGRMSPAEIKDAFLKTAEQAADGFMDECAF